MTTDTPSTSGEGADVLRVIDEEIKGLIEMMRAHPKSPHIQQLREARKRVAELIEAAEEYISKPNVLRTRLRAAINACRATQGAHP